jgi:hypothetical protein
MSDEQFEYRDEGEGDDEAVPLHRRRPPIVSLAITALFLVLGLSLLYIVRVEIAYFFRSDRPEVDFTPTPERPVPSGTPSNVVAQVRIDPRNLCDFWDERENPFPPDPSYAFTMKMGFGSRYFLTCVGNGKVRPRLWILKPESGGETAAIQQEAGLSRHMGTMLGRERVPEIHLPGGDACVIDTDPGDNGRRRVGRCRGRLIRFSEYAANPLGGVRRIQDVLSASLESELVLNGLPPLQDDDYLLILGETPGSKWWYVLLIGLVLGLSAVNLFFGLRFLRRYLAARREIEAHLRQVGAGGGPGKR